MINLEDFDPDEYPAVYTLSQFHSLQHALQQLSALPTRHNSIGGGAYWAAQAIARTLFGPNGQAILIALPLFTAP